MSEMNNSAKGPPADEGPDGGRAPLGLYAHVPFCATRCDFCAFYEERPTAGAVRRYLAGMEREAALLGGPLAVNTVFWGGGTPGVLAAADLRRLGEITRSCCAAAPVEWTVELAPGSVSEARLAVLRELGVTRISMGAQSFQPALLEALGRRHAPAQIHRAYDRIRAAGFSNVNLDLMFALPGQAEEAWLADLREAMALRPEHISTYCLTFEEDTALWVKLAQGKVKLDRAREAALYERTWAALEEAGYAQYEISNFARPGLECIHNLNTWRMGSWLGLGPSAASQHAGWRGANPSDLDAWLAGLERGRRATAERVRLTEALLAEDAVIFGLRMNAGVDLSCLRRRHPGADWAAADALAARLEGEGLAAREGDTLRLTPAGRLLADAVGAEVLGVLRSGEG